VTRIVSREDRALKAQIVRRVPMRYAAGADPSVDRPEHVRAASSVAWIGARLALVQDDANFVALVDPATGLADSITLPAGKDDLRQFDDGRGNKKHKLDLEAMMRVPGAGGVTLVAFGSGSKKRRESVMTLTFSGRGTRAQAGDPSLVHLPELYAALRAETHFAGSEMNIEGAVYLGRAVRLFGRGNGEASGALQPVDATGDLSWREFAAHLAAPDRQAVPTLSRITQYDLGAVDGIAYGFTDAIPVDRTQVLYSAAAEASANASDDGVVGGSALGVLPNERRQPARWCAVRDERGRRFLGKIEGMVLLPRDATRAYVVIDVDDHTRPSELCEVALTGPWFG
jgi:hypothetical protein